MRGSLWRNKKVLPKVEMAECDVLHIPGGFQYWPVSSTARAKASLANTSTTLLRQIATHTRANVRASLFSFACAVALRLTVSLTKVYFLASVHFQQIQISCCYFSNCAIASYVYHVQRIPPDHDILACKNAPMRAIAARASGRMRANICQTWNMRGHTSSSTSRPTARRRSAIRTASSRSASSLPT